MVQKGRKEQWHETGSDALTLSLHELLIARREEIVSSFVRGVQQKKLSPERATRSVLVDHIPIFLDEIGAELARLVARTSLEAVDVHAIAREHGGQRWQLGYDLEDLVREYSVLMHAILEAARSAGVVPSIDEFDLLTRFMGIGVAAATSEYVRSREEQLRARQADLEFLKEAGELLNSSLDYRSTLGRVTRLLVPRLAELCIVRLNAADPDETPMAHVDPTKLELMRRVERGFASANGPPLHAAVAQSGEAMMVDALSPSFFDAAAQTPEHLADLRALAARSWIVVPLKINDSVFGTITLARGESGRPYGQGELLLVQELALAAAGAIDNARLYELSREERARAEAATRTKDEFVATVSHELRTPLNVIIGWVRLLRSGMLSEARREQALDVIERNANAQGQLVSDLLDISRVITGKIRLEPAQVDLANLVVLVLEDARLALEAKRLRVETSLSEEGAAIMRGDAERLRQIVWNLLLNAVKFTPKEGQVWITLRRVESDLELTVRDSGIGIAAGFLPHIFDSFRQSDPRTTRAQGGLGLGLSIVKHLVDLHGGSIVARSDGIGKGAEFVVRLPVSPLISATLGIRRVPATSVARVTLGRPEVLAGSSVLVVDDEEDARELLRVVIEACDAQVYTASSVREALDLLMTTHVDLLVSDIGMPEEDGYSLIRAVRSLPVEAKSTIPAIALTAFAQLDDRTRALLAGFNLHMTKPVEPAELLTALADLSTHPGSKAEQ
jgi:signal transduction histidine kinase/ActR/RegA family two-component response regulator